MTGGDHTEWATAIIPARGGSKGVPRKNVLQLAGKPLIGWTIEAARRSETVNAIYVSTDCPEIAKIAERFGAGVIWRPAEISGDRASSEQALLHALDSLGTTNPLPELTVFLQCTSPLTTSEDIDGTVKALEDNKADTAVAVADFHYFLWKQGATGLEGINHQKEVRQLRQEREPNFLETGAVYVMKTAGFQQHRHRFFGTTAHYVMPAEHVLEIDEPVDFRVAEVLLQDRIRKTQIQSLPKQIELIVFDFDGVFTDNRVHVSENGIESVICNRGDGMGVRLTREAGFSLMILSSEENPVVTKRAEKLKVPVLHGILNKAEVLQSSLQKLNIDWASVVYVGNDLNDVECLRRAGCGVAVADAAAEALSSADIVLSRRGGDGAVRELLDMILARQ